MTSLYLRANFVLFIALTLLFGVVYPITVTLVNQSLFSAQSGGSLIKGKNSDILGSKLIGQNFTDPKYFWGRLSATSPQPYNAASSSGSNFGAANPDLLKAVQGRLDDLKKADPDNKKFVPVDLVTASGSGLDPHISMTAAQYQAARVAKARNMDEAVVQSLIKKHSEDRQFGVFGEPRVNVLMLNLELDGKL